MQRVKLSGRWLFVGIAIVALVLRLYHTSSQSIWWDEAYSVHLAQMPVAQAVQVTGADIHPPLYYILLHFWSGLFGFGEVGVRWLSALFGTAAVCAVYFLGKEVYGKTTGFAAMAIVTVLPSQLVYSQEARMYTLLSLEYVALLYALWRVTRPTTKRPIWSWVLLAVAEVALLYTHYFSAIMVAYANVAFFVWWWTHGKNNKLRGWLLVQIVALLAYLPWLRNAVTQMSSYATPNGTAPGPLQFLSTIWHFLNGIYGLAETNAAFRNASFILLALAIVACGLLFREREERRTHLSLIAHGVVPLAAVFVAWQFNPAVHPRYTIMFALPLYVLVAQGLVSLVRQPAPYMALAGGLGIAMMYTFGLGIDNMRYNEGLAKDDVRGLAAYVEQAADAGTLILVDSTDYALDYYYKGVGSIYRTDAMTFDGALGSLGQALSNKGKCLLVHRYGASDARGLYPLFLESLGRLTDVTEFRGYVVKTYELEQVATRLPAKPGEANYGTLHLVGVAYQDTATADNAICLALRWQLASDTRRNYAVSAVLQDGQGWQLVQADVPLLDEGLRGTRSWQADQETENYYLLPVPMGTPPGQYSLSIVVYDRDTMAGLDRLDENGAPAGQRYTLGQVSLTQGTAAADPYRTRGNIEFTALSAQAARYGLEGANLDSDTVAPGDKLGVLLSWKARETAPQLADFSLRLVRGQETLARDETPPGGEDHPPSEWQQGEAILDYHELAVDSMAPEGPAELQAVIGGRAVHIAQVNIVGISRSYELPPMQHQASVRFGEVAELVGYDLASDQVTAKGTVKLTLYWRALSEQAPGVSFVVFTHILDANGVLIGQHDGLPVGGGRPTTNWAQGEVLTDVHELTFRDQAYVGSGSLEIGFYDPATGERLLTGDGADNYVLPTQLNVGP